MTQRSKLPIEGWEAELLRGYRALPEDKRQSVFDALMATTPDLPHREFCQRIGEALGIPQERIDEIAGQEEQP